MISGGALTFITTANATYTQVTSDDSIQDVSTAEEKSCEASDTVGGNYTDTIANCSTVSTKCYYDRTDTSKTCKITTCTTCDTGYTTNGTNVLDKKCGFTVPRTTCVSPSCEATTTYGEWYTYQQGYESRTVTTQQTNCVTTQTTEYRCESGYDGTANCQLDLNQGGIQCSGCTKTESSCLTCPTGYANFSQTICMNNESDLSVYCHKDCSVPCDTIGQNQCTTIAHKSSCSYNTNESQSGVQFYGSNVCQKSATDDTHLVAKKCTVNLTCTDGYSVVDNNTLNPYCTENIYTVTVNMNRQLLLDGSDPGLNISPTTFYYKYFTDAYYETKNGSQLSNLINKLTITYETANYDFLGLYNQGQEKLVDAAGNFVSPGENIAKLYQRSYNTTLYPEITAKDFTVSFDQNGGTGDTADFTYTFSKTIANNAYCTYPGTNYETINKCTIPTKADHVFTGYYKNNEQYYNKTCSLATTDPIICNHSGNLSLVAKWDACTACSAGTGATCSMSVVNNACTYTTSCKTGYNTIQNNGKYNPSCTANEYTVKYLSNCNGATATGTMDEITHTYDAPKNLTSNGFTCGTKKFLGWSTSSTATSATYTNGQSVSNLTSTSGGTVKLYAVWKPCTACSPSNGATCNLTAPLGVCTYETGCETGYHGITNPEKYNPSCTINSYTIVYHGNGNTGGEMSQSDRTYGDGKKLTANAFTKTGYSFTGWNTQQNGTGTTYSDKWSGNLTDKNNVTINLYAQWTANEYTVTYSCGDGTTGSPEITTPDKIKYNATYTVKGMGTCAKSGSTFNGWKIKGTTTIKQPGNEFTWKYTENIEMIVEWKQCPAGYWCPDPTTENKCPLASTSNPGATKKTDCFLQGGSSKICSIVNGTKKCYPLPNGVQAFYSGVQ
ncbi:MAG: InlB B-repeat-containing protein [Alphaproteobacteria bacterium]|nr:InlB B-repeat-containing protein [Alphaproteobacteria bacterium]